MIGQVCAECKNYFIQKDVDIHASNYTVTNGQIGPVPFLKDGQYYRIVGSALNDGVYKHGVDDTALADEEFFGAVWAMRVPRDFVALCEEIQAWESTNGEALSGPYSSESFGGYSYSKATGSDGGAYTWRDQFKTRLNAYRRLSVL
jgi:hypothetical protein